MVPYNGQQAMTVDVSSKGWRKEWTPSASPVIWNGRFHAMTG
jgi:hypothetical protein